MNTITKRYKAVNFEFHLTCNACPEQYDVFVDGKQVGYVRLRWGGLSCTYPDVGGEKVFWHEWDDEYKGCFDTDDERDFYLEKIAQNLYNRIFSVREALANDLDQEIFKSEAVR